MTDCHIETLQQILLDILAENNSVFGVPLIMAKKQMMSRADQADMDCSQEDIDNAIQQSLDSWIVDNVLAPLSGSVQERLEVEPPGPFWHLKRLTRKNQEKYENLSPIERTLIRILRERDTPGRRGQIRVEEAERILSEKGFDDLTTDIWIEDVVDTIYRYEGEKEVKYYCLIEEYLKTDEYKQQHEEMLDERLRKQRRYIELMEDLEEESEQEADGN